MQNQNLTELDVRVALHNLDALLRDTIIGRDPNDNSFQAVVSVPAGEPLTQFITSLQQLGFKGDHMASTGGHPTDERSFTVRGDFGIAGHRCADEAITEYIDVFGREVSGTNVTTKREGDSAAMVITSSYERNGSNVNLNFEPGSIVDVELGKKIVEVALDTKARATLIDKLLPAQERTWAGFATGQAKSSPASERF